MNSVHHLSRKLVAVNRHEMLQPNMIKTLRNFLLVHQSMMYKINAIKA
jgi:hypothetical protein